MVTYITKGNIFKLAGVHAYAHGCNCAGAMGRGIAVQFKERYPEMYPETFTCIRMGKRLSLIWVQKSIGGLGRNFLLWNNR